MKVQDIMTKNVAYISPSSTLTEAAQLMQKHNVGSIPVCDQNGVVGIVTDRDIVVRNIALGKNPQNTPVSEIMTTQIKMANPSMEVDEASKIMSQYQVRRLPVVENNQIVGMVSLGDLAADQRFDMEAGEALAEISKPAKPEKMQK
ncbi:CBS domain-containing protein [Clostridium thermosuccinogenes]|uniref:CBS domain-containing protein n=1 Tax=Clostridium thermosuccinogenes TaxID=84032 RepID=A0A2K2F968_9CLOT|nr:CBS domain-containing protein [Pseudoclostridium thermosuccinogenes]AUS98513.1 CBS domain-containing protein [Pseudoclostridium thermosuccinogenes]PNT90823.1 CBS domain-containing protein [Pseudoclostridium thermosuccinogenes]PNT95304.1 CBS domain-containing protein [Pseudoclostridium thermosuccinogenes]PNT96216.1 CBS domain-containing protein [Pseudoclostridium thermosuccinogenes]